MLKNKKLIIGLVTFVVMAGLGGFFIYRDLKKINEIKPLPKTGIPDPNTGTSTTSANNVNIEAIKKQMPDLDRKIAVSVNLPTETRLKAISDIGTITSNLKKDYDQLDNWLNLGLAYKLIGDYEGARQVWEFVTLIRSADPVAYHNLGDLYSQYLKDFPKAEKNYLAAIGKDTAHQPFYYVKLYEFYLYYAKKPDLAEKTLVDALKTNPKNAYLQSLLDDFRKNQHQ